MKHSVLLDTSFFIRLGNKNDPLYSQARKYYKYLLENDYTLRISTISIAEYCVGGEINDLPLENLKIVLFNIEHAIRTGLIAKILFDEKKVANINLSPRAIIPNDAKLFAQCDYEKNIRYFVTSDARSKATFKLLNNQLKPDFEIIDIKLPLKENFKQG